MKNEELKIRESVRALSVEGGGLRVTASFHDGVAVIALEGRLVAGAECDALGYAVTVVRNRWRNCMVVDLSEAVYIDSAGLGILAEATKSTEESGGFVGIANRARRISDLLQITRIATIAALHDSVGNAVNAITLDSRDDAA